MDNLHSLNQTKELLHNSGSFYIICTDTLGNYSYVNNRYAESFSHIHLDLVGQPYYITMHPDDMRVCETVGGQCYENPGKLFPATIRKHDGNGGYVITQWEFILIVDNGEPHGIFCLGYDITDFINIKTEVQIVNNNLAVKNELLDAIAFEQSHIVRAPLANIVGLTGILKSLDLGSYAASVIEMLEQSSNQLDEVIKNIVHKTNS